MLQWSNNLGVTIHALNQTAADHVLAQHRPLMLPRFCSKREPFKPYFWPTMAQLDTNQLRLWLGG
jgi:hypothetical protein